MRNFAVAALVALFIAGCQTQPSQPDAPIDDKSGAGTSSAPGGATTAGAGTGGVTGSGVGSGAGRGPSDGGNPLRDPDLDL